MVTVNVGKTQLKCWKCNTMESEGEVGEIGRRQSGRRDR